MPKKIVLGCTLILGILFISYFAYHSSLFQKPAPRPELLSCHPPHLMFQPKPELPIPKINPINLCGKWSLDEWSCCTTHEYKIWLDDRKDVYLLQKICSREEGAPDPDHRTPCTLKIIDDGQLLECSHPNYSTPTYGYMMDDNEIIFPGDLSLMCQKEVTKIMQTTKDPYRSNPYRHDFIYKKTIQEN